ncbi:radical SAM protein [Pontiellaceae bacterium B12227]|nr:radical SAM protein [Pontiellaceae bacterium B12227]
MKKYKHLFGPVPSRRFGRSLGIDLTPYKTCSFDCIFCQLGRTTTKTLERRDYVPIKEVTGELDEWIHSGGEADYITLSGSGEPTLHARFGEVIEFVRAASSIPVVLLTNGSALGIPEVRAAAAKADVVKVSLSAGDEASFNYINRPHPALNLAGLIAGMQTFRQEFDGRLWLEIFMIWGVNSTQKEVAQLAEWARSVHPDRIQLNTAVRPPAEGFVRPMPRQKLQSLTVGFDPPAEIIAEFSSDITSASKANEETILAMLQRRPCTEKDISDALGLHLNEVAKYLGKLQRTGRIETPAIRHNPYYICRSNDICSVSRN